MTKKENNSLFIDEKEYRERRIYCGRYELLV